MDWNVVWQGIISGGVLRVIGSIVDEISGCFKGKKKSSMAIERKNEIYQPLINELEKYSDFNWSIIEKIKTPLLSDIVNNGYKYGIDEELQNKATYLYTVINKHNNENIIQIAHSIVVDIFEKGYTEIYGSIIDGILYHSDRDGNEWEEEVLATPVETIYQCDYSKELESLLLNEGICLDEVCVDEENSLYEPIYLQLKRIYSSALYVRVNNKKYTLPKPIIEMTMLPEEYIALNFDFFDIYNNDKRIKKKYELREEIIYTSQSIVQDLKEIVERIIKKYEVEDI